MEKTYVDRMVSVIMPCYNAAPFLAETLESVIAQTYSQWECIIVNDGSRDNSEEVALEYVNRDSRIKYFSQKNQGPSVARNNGIAYSVGEFLLFLDSDDLIDPTYMEKAMRHFELHPETKLVYCRADKFGEQSGEWMLPKYSYDNLIRANCLFSTVFLRRIDYNKVGGFNEEMRLGLEDYEFWLELLGPNDVVYQINEVLFHYRIRNASRTVVAYENNEILKQLMRAVNKPAYQFAVERFNYRKHIIIWPKYVFANKTKEKYIQFYGDTWRKFRKHDIWQCITYPYMVIWRKCMKTLKLR